MGKFYFVSVLAVLIYLFSFSGCGENPIDLKKNIFNPEIQGSLKDTTLYAIEDTTYHITSKINTQLSSYLFIGQSNGLTAYPAFEFYDFTAIPDSATIQGASLILTAASVNYTEAGKSFTATAYPILNQWNSNVDSVWNTQNYDPAQPLGEMQISSDPADSVATLDFNTAGLEKIIFWADTANLDENYGFILHFQSADFLRYFYALNSGYNPSLIVSYTLPSSAEVLKDTIPPGLDAFIYSGQLPKVEQRDYASSLFVYNTLLKFDMGHFMDKFPNGVVINSANLEVPVDKDNSIIKIGLANLIVENLKSAIGNDSVEVDSTAGDFVSLSQWSEDSTYLEITPGLDRQKLARNFIQPQLRDTSQYPGLAINFINSAASGSALSNAQSFYSYVAFYKRSQQNSALKPRLKLTFWVPPAPRF
ncbi:MAG: hypothetical protein P8184_03995 [Calditrichia bacterium]